MLFGQFSIFISVLANSLEYHILSKFGWESYDDINVNTIQANSWPWKLSKCQQSVFVYLTNVLKMIFSKKFNQSDKYGFLP